MVCDAKPEQDRTPKGLSSEANVTAGISAGETVASGSTRGYFHVTSIPKKCMNTSRFGLFFGFCCGLRM